MNIHLFLLPMRIRDENKERVICRKAMEMVVAAGFDGLSMGKLAKEATVSPATIYIYFKDKEDLLEELCKRENAKMVEATMRDFDPEMHFEEGLRIQWRNRLRYWLDNPLEAQFLELARHSPYGQEAVAYVKKQFSEQMGQFVHNALKRGEMMPLPLEVYWPIAFGPLYTLIKFHAEGRSIGPNAKNFKLTDETVEEALKLVLKALKP